MNTSSNHNLNTQDNAQNTDEDDQFRNVRFNINIITFSIILFFSFILFTFSFRLNTIIISIQQIISTRTEIKLIKLLINLLIKKIILFQNLLARINQNDLINLKELMWEQ